MPHKNFFELEAATHYELGLKKGKLFGESLRNILSKEAHGRNWKRRVARSLPYLEASREHFPKLIEEIDGYARGAGVALEDLWAWDLDDDLVQQPLERCTTVVTNNGFLLAHNEDWQADAEKNICVLKRTTGNVSSFELYYLHTLGGCSVSVNSHGIVHAVNSLTHTDHGIGVPRNVVARWLSDTASPEQAIAKLPTIQRASGFHHTFVQLDGTTWSVECSAKQFEAAKVTIPFVHTNHSLSPRLAEFEAEDNRAGTLDRYQHARRSVQPHMSILDAQALLDDASAGSIKSIFNRRTIARIVVDIDHMAAYVWLARERKRGWVEYANLFE